MMCALARVTSLDLRAESSALRASVEETKGGGAASDDDADDEAGAFDAEDDEEEEVVRLRGGIVFEDSLPLRGGERGRG
jgi:hypothetical protein